MDYVEQPITDAQADQLFDAIHDGLRPLGETAMEACDHKLTFTQKWCEAAGVEFETVRSWLHSRGGFCDCEVLMNVDPQAFEEDDEGEGG